MAGLGKSALVANPDVVLELCGVDGWAESRVG
jgi:hypothetical protein